MICKKGDGHSRTGFDSKGMGGKGAACTGSGSAVTERSNNEDDSPGPRVTLTFF